MATNSLAPDPTRMKPLVQDLSIALALVMLVLVLMTLSCATFLTDAQTRRA
jgi:hypothetical protein